MTNRNTLYLVSLSSFLRCAGLGNNHDIVNPNTLAISTINTNNDN
jgi:hypothetical protein